nr:uncharacterized protein LOC111508888 [Leptinotarsa decemlineata]
MAIKQCCLCLVSLLIVIPSDGAPKSKKSDHHSPHTLYDQKQTGDYNIQLHLKDFQIIAVLSDEASSLGDYDYDYDYSDFTVKPATQKPTETASISSSSTSAFPSSTPVGDNPSSTVKPSNHPYPIVSPSTESSKEKEPTKTEESSVSTESQSNEPSKDTGSSTTTPKTLRKDEYSAPGKIKVQIIETPVSVGIVPGEDVHEPSENLPQGEILQLKRCASGFSRDKRGRCRRVRRPGNSSPHLQYGISRLASNLASRFRHGSSDVSSSSSESSEN